MSRANPCIWAGVLVAMTFFYANNAMALPKQAHHDEIKSCRFLGKVHGSSKHGKHRDWKRLAKHRALMKAKNLGASRVVWHHIKPMRFFSAKLSRLSRRQFELIILRYRYIVALALLATVKGHLRFEVATGPKCPQT